MVDVVTPEQTVDSNQVNQWVGGQNVDGVNRMVSEDYNSKFVPVAERFIKEAGPEGTPEGRIESSRQLQALQKNFTKEELRPFNNPSADETRWADILSAKDPGDVAIGINGGADQRVEAYSLDGKRYYKVFNQRVSAANPLGEFRRYETYGPNPRPLLPEEVEKIGIIVSPKEVPLTQIPGFIARGISAKEVAQEQSRLWTKQLKVADTVAKVGGQLSQSADESAQILSYLVKEGASINPATRTLLAGANNIRTGNTQEIQNASDTAFKIMSGNASSSEKANYKKNNLGVSIGVYFGEGNDARDSNGKKLSKEEVDDRISRAQSGAGSSEAIESRKQDLLDKAQLLAAKGDIRNIDMIQRYINLNAQTARMIREIEDAGGIGLAQPNLDYNQGDSFSLGFAKAKLDSYYAHMADKFARRVFDVQSKTPDGYSPPIGYVNKAFINDRSIGDKKKEVLRSIDQFIQENGAVLDELNKQEVNPSLLKQPSAIKEIGGAAVPAPREAAKAKQSQSGGQSFDLNSIIPIKKRKGG